MALDAQDALLVLAIVCNADILDVDAGDGQIHDDFSQDTGAVFDIDMQDIGSVDRTAGNIGKTLAVLSCAVKKFIDGTAVT